LSSRFGGLKNAVNSLGDASETIGAEIELNQRLVIDLLPFGDDGAASRSDIDFFTRFLRLVGWWV